MDGRLRKPATKLLEDKRQESSEALDSSKDCLHGASKAQKTVSRVHKSTCIKLKSSAWQINQSRGAEATQWMEENLW